ncbi:MAG: hypothetical protein HHAS10_11670 [Candidatus Altimarinota bacterium]
MQSQDILFIVLSVCAVFISIPLMMVLWKAYSMMDHANKLLEYANHLRELAIQFESVPMRFIESVIGSFSKETKNPPGKK